MASHSAIIAAVGRDGDRFRFRTRGTMAQPRVCRAIRLTNCGGARRARADRSRFNGSWRCGIGRCLAVFRPRGCLAPLPSRTISLLHVTLSTATPRGGVYPRNDGATNTCHSERTSPRESRRIPRISERRRQNGRASKPRGTLRLGRRTTSLRVTCWGNRGAS